MGWRCTLNECAHLSFESMTAAGSRIVRRYKKRGSPQVDLQRRLEDIELIAVSAIRNFQMEIDGDIGVPSTTVLRKARTAIL
jgi:hypothetical protein